MTTSALPKTPATVSMAAQDIRPGRIIVEDDGRTRRVRVVKYGCETVVLVYTAGPSDVYRRNYMLDVVPTDVQADWDNDPCANCGREVADHDRNDMAACQAEHLAHLGLRK
jgi:hypothetical protein